jgi:sugar phosphate isomerase/epimerase
VRLIGPKVDKGLVRARYTHALEWAAKLGAKCAVFGSPWAKFRPEDVSEERAFEELAFWCAEFGEEAARQGLILAIEPNNRTETNMINTFSQAVALAKTVDHPNVRCLQDYFHLGMEHDTVDSLLEHGRDWLVHTHFARIEKRGFPCSTAEDSGYADFFAALRSIGYDGGVSMEGFLVSRDTFPEEAAATCAFLKAAAHNT